MTYEIQCTRDLGIQDCDFVAQGETPADVLGEVVEHLREEHDLDVPEANTILEGKDSDDWLTEDVDEGVVIIVRRLRETLEIDPPGGPWETEVATAPPPSP